jgi:PadR family transcriptional regulator, regulatory protein PadR
MAETMPPALPRNFLRPCLLLLLREDRAHGYDLLERLRPLGFLRDDPGRLYRALRALEDEGLVHSAWEASEAGPDRRIYELTRAGTEELHAQAGALAATVDTLERFLSRYEEFVALGRRGAVSARGMAKAHPSPQLE